MFVRLLLPRQLHLCAVTAAAWLLAGLSALYRRPDGAALISPPALPCPFLAVFMGACCTCRSKTGGGPGTTTPKAGADDHKIKINP